MLYGCAGRSSVRHRHRRHCPGQGFYQAGSRSQRQRHLVGGGIHDGGRHRRCSDFRKTDQKIRQKIFPHYQRLLLCSGVSRVCPGLERNSADNCQNHCRTLYRCGLIHSSPLSLGGGSQINPRYHDHHVSAAHHHRDSHVLYCL